ncbi:MAG: B12-binding domain-containing radical SAM protein [Candidatus Omnitrophica bacterium]|nr:B12-binding domain-containing radical SAM protein [Candidatus Omnitrophota bacterium]
MKVLLLNPPFFPRFSRSQRSPAVTKSGTLYYPVWLAYAAAVLEQRGFDLKLIDAPAQGLAREDVMEIARDFNPGLIVVGTSTPSIYNDVSFASNLKKMLTESFITLVGTHVSALAEESLELDTTIDAVARGEYDYTVADLAKTLNEKGDLTLVLGITFRKNGAIINNDERPKINELDNIPFVSSMYKKHLNIKNYFFAASDYPMVQIFTARGCPFRCFFCVYPQTIHGNTYRKRNPENVVEEFVYIQENLPEVREVVIEDDTFSVDKNRVRRICELLIQKNVKLKWNANVRADLDLNTMKLMKKAGCRLIIIGFESADQQILDNIDKGAQVERMEEFFKDTKKAGLLLHAAFMAGNPGETEETLERTFAMAKRFMPDTVQFFPLMAYPGTRAYDWAKENNLLKSNDFSHWLTKEGLHNCVLNLPELSSKKLVQWCDTSRRNYYLSFRYLWYKLKQVIVHPEEAKRTIMAIYRFKKFLWRGSFKK